MLSASLLAVVSISMQAGEAEDVLGERTGGDTTVFATGRNAFSFPLATLSDEEAARFAVGNSFFRRNWVQAPASTRARDGLGPHFIARSCGGCHVQDGRGAPPDLSKRPHDPPVSLLLRLSVPGSGAHGGVLADPVYGDQFNNAAIDGVRPEGRVTLRTKPLRGRFSDGTGYALQQPVYGFEGLGYGAMARNVMVSPRIAPQLAGVGLLDAIPEVEIVRNGEAQAEQPGPIKGRPNRVWDAYAGEMRVGRFGWKANVATIAHQTAGAFLGDIGITSTLFSREACTPIQRDCLTAAHSGKDGGPEIDDTTLGQVVFYQSTLAPAARRSPTDSQVLRGQELFTQAQCSTCHRASYVTGDAPFGRLSSLKVSGQRIWPYTDLLLHDMGEDLADHRPDFQANGRQWKTPPLWGIGLIRDVNGHQRLLHDGRADGVLEAILWHGGEAQDSKRHVLHMSADDRQALVKFVESL